MLKKNIILTCIFFFLLGGVYLKEEILFVEKQRVSSLERSVIKIQNIKRIKTKYGELAFDKKWKYTHGALVVSKFKVDQFIKILKDWKIQDSIFVEDSREYFNENEIKVIIDGEKGKRLAFFVGNFSPLSNIFYLREEKNSKKVYLVKDESVYDSLYQSTDELPFKKYKRNIGVLKQFKTVFSDTLLVNQLQLNLTSILKIEFKSEFQPWFDLDIQHKSISRPIPKPLVLASLEKQVEKLFGRIQVLNILKDKINGLEEKGVITFYVSQGKKVIRYFQFKQKENILHFIAEDEKPFLFQVDFKKENPFDIHDQFFWDKRIAYDVDFNELKKINFDITLKGKSYKFIINDLDTFEVTSEDKRISFISATHMNFLFNLIFNLVDFEQASYVVPSRVLIEKDSSIVIKIFEKVLIIKLKDQYIQVYDKKEDLSYYFKYNSKQIGLNFFSRIIQTRQESH